MTIQRVEIDSIMGKKHGPMVLEGRADDKLPTDRVYVNTRTGSSISGTRGNKLRDLAGGEIELPRTTWYGG